MRKVNEFSHFYCIKYRSFNKQNKYCTEINGKVRKKFQLEKKNANNRLRINLFDQYIFLVNAT